METLNRTFSNATTALWNEFQPGEQQQLQPHGDEPLSGIQGKGTATDPYDGGNRDDQPGAPRSQANTAVIPEPLVSVTAPSDHAKNPKSPSNADVALKSVIVDEPASTLPLQQQNKKMETPDPLTAAAPTAAAEAAGAPSSGSHGTKQLAASGVGLPAGKTQVSSSGGVSEQRGSLPASSSVKVPSSVGVAGSGSGTGTSTGAAGGVGGETLPIREKKKGEILQQNRGLPAPEGMKPEQKSSSLAATGTTTTTAGTSAATAGGSTGTGALQTRDTPATIPTSSVSADDKAYKSKEKPITSASTLQPQQQQMKPDASKAKGADKSTSAAAATASDTESVGPTNETKEARDSAATTSPTSPPHHETKTETDPLPRGNNKVSEEALKGPQTPAPREPFEFEKRLGSKGGPAKPDTGAADEAEKHGKGHGQGKMAHLKEKVGKVLHHGK
ncbi:hypothetical protein BO82DRAFT_401251 [Aspergillus uvarum CBS 121591]|uniref:Uncharacterized protein n=1 Tax=Aspergillus uvarum CBS 121591 TaxID=1448315 RepID=A0A319C9X8_9EURO|nr:hypothetical protein BO82DRAFT_401251 [Aspergillus uvarum CBS 121591]PYH82606.1 hypothetical protein BO82DRAFT_401251 [Aspergillus uvarum CBS 121591]